MRGFRSWLLAGAWLWMLAACSVWTRIEDATLHGPDKEYSIKAPIGWVQLSLARDRVLITRDGPGLQVIEVRRQDHEQAFPRLEKSTTAQMLAQELAELQIAEDKASPGNEAAEVLNNKPAAIGGQSGFRLHVQVRNAQGLRYQRVTYGFVTERGYYTLIYQAPALHYFPQYLDVFEKVVGSFRLGV